MVSTQERLSETGAFKNLTIKGANIPPFYIVCYVTTGCMTHRDIHRITNGAWSVSTTSQKEKWTSMMQTILLSLTSIVILLGLNGKSFHLFQNILNKNVMFSYNIL